VVDLTAAGRGEGSGRTVDVVVLVEFPSFREVGDSATRICNLAAKDRAPCLERSRSPKLLSRAINCERNLVKRKKYSDVCRSRFYSEPGRLGWRLLRVDGALVR